MFLQNVGCHSKEYSVTSQPPIWAFQITHSPVYSLRRSCNTFHDFILFSTSQRSIRQSFHAINLKKNPWPQSASDHRLLTKLVTTFADTGCQVVSVTDPYGRNLGFLDRSPYFFFQVAPQLYSRGWVGPVPDPLLLRKCGSAGNRTRASGSVVRNSDHRTKVKSFPLLYELHKLSYAGVHPNCCNMTAYDLFKLVVSHEFLSRSTDMGIAGSRDWTISKKCRISNSFCQRHVTG
jgi:hypothetical protein